MITQIYEKMKAEFKKIQDAQPTGEYKETEIDQKKKDVDFRLIDLDYIVWKDGTRQRVTKRQLKKFQEQHTWTTDF